jgi:hypothetical protein
MFEDRSADVADNAAFTGYGAAVTPGRDGPMVLVAGCGCANQLRTWRDGELRDRSCGIIADASRQAVGVAAADLDADGSEELYVHNTDTYSGVSGNTDLLLDRIDHDGRTVWCDAFAHEINADRGNFNAGRSVAALDRFGTGRYGMVVASYEADTRFYELGDNGEITDMSDATGLATHCGARSLVTAPLVTDSMDVFVGVERGPNRLFRNDDGHFVDVATDHEVTAPDADARGATLVDTGDGSFALAVGSWEDDNHLFVPTDDGFSDVSPPAFADPTRLRTLVAADFDNDGRQELFGNVLGGENQLFERIDSESASPPEWTACSPGDAAEPRGLGTGAVTADFDGDGTLELLIVHGEVDSQPLSLYGTDTDNDWLRVRPTTQHGAPARGAVVTLDTDRGRQRRVIDAGSSYLCQCEPVAHFGLGGSTTPERTPQQLTVRWPGGHERTVSAPATTTTHAVAHPSAE